MKHLVLGIVIGVTVGATAGYFVWSTPSGAGRAEGGGSAMPTAPVPSGASASSSPPPLPAPSPISTTPIPEGAVATLVKALPRLDVPRGDGVIRGTVRTPDGAPLGGVQIAAIPNGGPPGLEVPDGDESLEAYVTRVATARLWRDSSTRRTESRADGTYELTGIGPAEYRMVGWDSEHVVQPPRRVGSVTAGATVDFTATPLVRVPANVHFPDGTQPETATVVVARGTGGRETTDTLTWKRAQPEVRLRHGAQRLSASVGTPVTAASKELEVEIGAGAAPSLDFVLTPSCTIRGRVVVPDGEQVSGSIVAWVKGTIADPVTPNFVYEQGTNRYQSPADAVFVFDRLDPGLYTLLAVRGDNSGEVGKVEITLTEGLREVMVHLPPRDRTLAIEAIVLDPAGRPVEGVEFRVSYRNSNGSYGTGLPVLEAKAGRYVLLPEVPPEWRKKNLKLSDIETEVTAQHPEFGSTTARFKLGVERELRIQFAPVATLVVSVSGADAVPEGATIRMALSPEKDPDSRSTTHHSASRSGDDFRFDKVAAGAQILTVYLEENHRSMPVHRQSLTLPAGVTRITVALPRLHELRVRVPDGRAGSRISATRRGTSSDRSDWGASRNEELDAEGRVVFAALPEGTYELRYQRKRMEVYVPASGEVSFDSRADNALRIRIKSRDGFLAKAGFEDGDLVIGLGDTLSESADELGRKFSTAFLEGDPKVSFLVQRGGRRLSITVPNAVKESDDPGGEVEPARR